MMDMTILELIQSGATVDIWYLDNENEEEAREKLTPFTEIGEFKKRELGNGKFTVNIDSMEVSVHSSYEEHETEHAQARLTEYERKLKESGHKQSDFL